MTSVLPEISSPFGERVRQRLTDEAVVWLTTVSADHTPQPNPVWFLWDGAESLLIYNRPDAKRLASFRSRPRVSLNFDSTSGQNIVVMTGEVAFVDGAPPATDYPDYVEKYRERIAHISGSVEVFAKTYTVPVRVTLTRIRGF
jgi:PPOX class probable F420-dependent enzyme